MFYLTREQLPFFLPLGFIGVYRWFFFLIRIIAWCLYRPHRPRTRPRYKSSRDVTIIVPTIDSGEEIKLAVRSWLKSDPNEIIFVTIPKAEQDLLRLAREVDPDSRKIRVITIPRPNKRNQMVAGINHTRTEIIVFCDDDVIWPPTMLAYLLAPFEDRQMGGVGTSQTVMAVNKRWTIWEILSAYRISMRNIEITATTYIDGGVCCLSGRTAAYRTKILLDPDFQWKFTHEFWLGRFHQHSGDDKFLTRWLHAHQWKTWIQACQEAELSSTFKDNWRFLLQLLRWTRNTWRSDMRSLFFERHVWFRHPFVAFSMLDKMFNPFTLLAGPVTVVYLCVRGGEQLPIWVVIVSYVTWLLVTRLLKYMPHFVKRPQDIFTLPIWIVFNVYFALMKLYCLFTLHITDWGTRTGADHNTKASEKETMDIYTPHW
ncbi:nucleotide-diphospho-sugar transferase, partial [Cladochytrium replicatum]